MRQSRRMRLVAIGAVCALVGAGAGIAGSTASSPSRHARASRAGDPARDRDRHPVHAEAVVLNRAGTAFITVTVDAGTVQSVSGDQLTLKEEAHHVTYKTVTLTIPSDAKVYRNFAAAQLSDLKSGDRAHVASSSDGTFVMAVDSSHLPRPGAWHRGRRGPGPGPGGPGPWPGGPPPPGP